MKIESTLPPEKALDTPIYSVGLIARQEGVPVSQIQYVLRSRPTIKPSHRAGNIRLFTGRQYLEIRSALAGIANCQLLRGGKVSKESVLCSRSTREI